MYMYLSLSIYIYIYIYSITNACRTRIATELNRAWWRRETHGAVALRPAFYYYYYYYYCYYSYYY